MAGDASDGRMLLHGLLPSVDATVTPYDVGTMMPLTSREESISSLPRTRRPRFRSGRSLRSLGSPLNVQPLGASSVTLRASASRSPERRADTTAVQKRGK